LKNNRKRQILKPMICQHCNAQNKDNAKYCKNCGLELVPNACFQCGHSNSIEASFCGQCGSGLNQALWQRQPTHQHPQIVSNTRGVGYFQQQPIIPVGQPILIQNQVAPPQPSTNGIGTAGFVLALTALFLSWAPGVGWLVWFLGLILSFIGVFREPKGLAIAGLIISFVSFIILVVVASVILDFLSDFL